MNELESTINSLRMEIAKRRAADADRVLADVEAGGKLGDEDELVIYLAAVVFVRGEAEARKLAELAALQGYYFDASGAAIKR